MKKVLATLFASVCLISGLSACSGSYQSPQSASNDQSSYQSSAHSAKMGKLGHY